MIGEVVNMVSSSEEERDDIARQRDSNDWLGCQTPFKGYSNFLKRSASTPMTVTEMTPSPTRSTCTTESVSPADLVTTLRPSPPTSKSFLSLKQGYLDGNVSTALFRDATPSQTRRKQQSSSRRSRLSESLLLVDYENPKLSLGVERRRYSASHRKSGPFRSNGNSSPVSSSPDLSSLDNTPDSSPDRNAGFYARTSSISQQDLTMPSYQQKYRGRSHLYFWGFLALCLSSSLGMICLTRSAAKLDRAYEATRPDVPLSASGLRGQMTSGHWEGKTTKHRPGKDRDKHHDAAKQKVHTQSKPSQHSSQLQPKKTDTHHTNQGNHKHEHPKEVVSTVKKTVFQMNLPPTPIMATGRKFEKQDLNMYSHHSSNGRRVVALDPSNIALAPPRNIKVYPADFTDNTQLYSILDSSDERLSHMERRDPYAEGECVPMQDWQTTFHPSCNGMHEIAMHNMGEDNGNDVNLFGTKGFWRYAWRLDVPNVNDQDTLVLKTLKYVLGVVNTFFHFKPWSHCSPCASISISRFEHNFEDAHFEHDRVDAVAMERLTSSPHVINVFGFCGHSVLTEYADGSRVGELADKSKKTPLARLKIARDIAHGLADVHGIDGDGNATFVHLDINPANVVSIGGTLKLNDFNIGIIRRWNTTSNTPCGFPAQYPNPQVRTLGL